MLCEAKINYNYLPFFRRLHINSLGDYGFFFMLAWSRPLLGAALAPEDILFLNKILELFKKYLK